MAAMENAARRIGAPPVRWCGADKSVLAKRMDFIFLPQLFYQKIFYFRKKTRRAYPMKIATIRLQWNPKAKMMRTVRIISAIFYCG
jgi:hypothetical protein